MSSLNLKIILIICAVSMMSVSFALAIQPDAYEEDNIFSYAAYIPNGQPQQHNFHAAGDQDWVKFYAFSGETYAITANNIGSNCDLVLEAYDTDGITLLQHTDDNGTGIGKEEYLQFNCSVTGVYYVKVSNADASVFGDGTEYDLKVGRQAGNNGNIKGVIYNNCSNQTPKEKISGVKITIFGNGIADSFINPFVGDYLISLIPNASYTIKFEAAGYQILQAQNVSVKPNEEITRIDIGLEPLVRYTYYRDADGDCFGDPDVTIQSCSSAPPQGYSDRAGDCNDADPAVHPSLSLPDVIAILKILSGMNTAPPICLKTYTLGMSDAIYILQIVAGLR